MVYAGGVEELCSQTFEGFESLGLLSGTEGATYQNCPFDARRNGITFGEGACLVVLEDLDYAMKRKANILGEILGFGYFLDTSRFFKYNQDGKGMKESIMRCVQDSKMEVDKIDYICAAANSSKDVDQIESKVVEEIFSRKNKLVPISSIKSMIGECYSSAGALSVVAGLGAINEGFLPPTINYQEKDPNCDLNYVPNHSREKEVNNVLINSFGPMRSSCMVLSKFKG